MGGSTVGVGRGGQPSSCPSPVLMCSPPPVVGMNNIMVPYFWTTNNQLNFYSYNCILLPYRIANNDF